MVRDPLYRAIEKRLDERLDPELFERCALDLLRNVYPGLVPIRGGSDGGMDGAIADPRGGTPMPLVVTTAGSVIRNLTASLNSYRERGGSASEAVLATSQPLTARQRKNLEQRARELGFTLRQIHDGADFTGRLYRDPAWRRELLGLAGDPPALSVFPRSPRPWPVTELLGRDEELAWLRAAKGDVVVGGQPGVGKTALLGALAKEGLGLFVVSRDIGKIADALRELSPDRVFVDDAHLDAAHPRNSLLSRLVWLRQELGMAFRIVATTWPGHEDDIRQLLYLTQDKGLRVNPLERMVMLELVRNVNPYFTEVLMGEILDQSEGRPGLAVTLAHWAQRGELKELVNGRLLLGQVSAGLPPPDSTIDALAPFALGGGIGMCLQSAARALGIAEIDLREALRPVSGTGVLQEFEEPGPHVGSLAVKPDALRVALVERAYFSGGLTLNIDHALRQVEDPAACTYMLIQVLARGGSVTHQLIRTRLQEMHRFDFMGGLWSEYLRTGDRAARWVLENHPEMTVSVGRAALAVLPEMALDRLLDCPSKGGEGGNNAGQIIVNWVQAGLPGRDAIDRRLLLLARLTGQMRDTHRGQLDTWTWGRTTPTDLFRAAFSLSIHGVQTSPLDRLSLNITSGSLLPEEVRTLAREWPSVLGALGALGDDGIRCARDILNEWTGRLLVRGQHPETNPTAEGEAPGMLEGVVELAEGAPGIVMWARRLARYRGLIVGLPHIDDPLLAKLFPSTENPWDRIPHDAILASAREIAEEWRRENPDTVVERMLYYERQRLLAGHDYPDVLRYVTDAIAQTAGDPLTWLDALTDQEASARWVWPFLEAAVVAAPTSSSPWEILARNESYDRVCVRVGLSITGLSDDAVRCIIRAVGRSVGSRLDDVPWGELSGEWQGRLLQDTNSPVRAAAAAGLWRAHRRKRPHGPLGKLLRDAAIEAGDPELLKELFRADPEVARAWVLQQARVFSTQRSEPECRLPWPEIELPLPESIVRLGDVLPGAYMELLKTAIAKLTLEDRRDLILAIPAHADERFYDYLVGMDPDLYRVVLRRHLPQEAHLAPLQREPSEALDSLIQLARRRGYTTCEIKAANVGD